MSKKQQNQQQEPNKEKRHLRKNASNAYMKYTGMAFQMGIIILVGTLIGQQLDKQVEWESPYLTALFALLSVFVALYLSLKDLSGGK